MTAANSSNQDFWTVIVTVWGICAAALVGVWLMTRRLLRRDRLRYTPPAELPDPALATAKEVAILLAREMYDRGEFQRAVVRRVPSDLFSDDLVLECGHTAGAARAGEEVEHANCHACARAWSKTRPGPNSRPEPFRGKMRSG
jgi:hypothetical protein